MSCSFDPKSIGQLIDDYEVEETMNNWAYVIGRTLNTQLAEDAHLVKLVHSLKAAETAFGPKNGLYLKTAAKTVEHVTAENLWKGLSDEPHYILAIKQT